MTRLPAPSAVRCLLVSAALLAYLVAIVDPPKAWAAVSSVNVTATNLSNFDLPVELSELGDPAIDEATYTVRNGSVEVTNGYSLKQVLDYAAGEDSRLDYSKAQEVTVGAIKVISRTIDSPASKPPVFFENDAGMTFVKEAAGSSQAAKSVFTLAPRVSIRSRTNQDGIPVTLAASENRIEAGETVNFAATVDPPPGANLQYGWTFGDGTTRKTSNSSTTHKFRKPGRMDVLLTVTDLASGNQGGDAVEVQVGEVKEQEKDRDGGENYDGGGDSGTSTPPADYVYGGYDYDYGTPGRADGTGTSPGPSSPPSAPVPEQETELPVDDGLETISGELVSSTAPATTVPPGEAGAIEEVPEAAAESSGFGISTGAWTVIGMLALFGFGMLAERRGSRLG